MFKFLQLLAATVASTFCWIPASHAGQADHTWPERPITLIVPFSPGGNVDTTTRLIGQKLSEQLGQPVVVDNVAGAGGILGIARAVQAPADGYTAVMGFDGAISVAQLINPAVKYDAETDLIPVGLVTVAPVVLMASPELRANTVSELIDLARANPGTLSYASSGVGTVLHLAMELLQQQANIDLIHVPYRGGAQITADVMGGQVDMGMLVTTSATPLVQQGKLRALAVSSAQRVASLPNVPAFAETPMLKDFDLNTWAGLFVPADTPPAIVNRFNRELNAVLQREDVRKFLIDGGATPGQSTPTGFAQFLKKEKAVYAQIVKTAKLRQD